MKGRTDFVIPECYVDTNLVETLVCLGGCNHQKGCNQVAKVMQEKFSDRFAVGMIDADKRRPSYLAEFNEIAYSEHLGIYRHPARHHYLILVHPAIDGFILSCAASAGVSPADYGLPAELKQFTSVTQEVMSNKDSRFKSLFRALAGTGEMRLLQLVLAYLVAETYAANNNEIQALFHI